jgi:uncharacterized protein involved in response to NO
MVHGRQAPLAMLAGLSLSIYFLFSGWYLLRVRKGETKRRSAQVAALLMALAWLGLSFDTGRLSGLEVLALVPAFSCLAIHALDCRACGFGSRPTMTRSGGD